MPSYLDLPDRLTTEHLIAEVAQQTGYTPTPVQLRHWVKAGLIPKAQQVYPGRGHGRGSVALWKRETCPRLVIILQARTGRTGKNINLDQAALLLAVRRWPPTQGRVLRNVLQDYIQVVADVVRPLRSSQQQGMDDPRQRLIRSLKRRNTGQLKRPKAARNLAYQLTAAFAGLPDPDLADPFSQLSRYLSVDGLRTALGVGWQGLDGISDDDLLQAYETAGTLLDTWMPVLEQGIRNLYGMRDDRPLRLGSDFTDALPRSADFTATDMLRLPATLAVVAYHGHKAEVDAAIQQAIPDLMHLFSQSGGETKGEDAPPQTAGPQES